ncbi:MAG: hypothetical protein WD604_16445 [Balneolaceae bacterium]
MTNRIKLLVTSVFLVLLITGATFYSNDQQDDSMELHSIMRLIMMDIHTINEGIYTQNYALIEQGAQNINEHPPLAPETRQLVQETLGERMAQFGVYDKIVHDTADSLRQAAIDRDMGRVRNHYRIIEQGCVSCHASFQNEIKQRRITGADEIQQKE